MSEQEARLLQCFSSVFPGLSTEEIRGMAADLGGGWDSLATVTLASVIQEEFNVEIDPDLLPELKSFEAFHAYISRVSPAGA
jgi:acyl carrier protein